MTPWLFDKNGSVEGSVEVNNGALCLRVVPHPDAGSNQGGTLRVRHREMVLRQGHTYTLTFKAWSSGPAIVSAKLSRAGPPYSDYWAEDLKLGPEPQTPRFEFSMAEPDNAIVELALVLVGPNTGAAPIEACVDEVILSDPGFVPPPPVPEVEVPTVRVNQVGYVPREHKVAVWVSETTTPQRWRLTDASGSVVADGLTTVHGDDPASGDHLHIADFDSANTAGKGFVLEVSGERSDAFDIRPDVYQKMKYDAFKYFYHNRSGISIELPFAGHERWARPAGHAPDLAPCAEDIGCSYTLDVTGGWYDAGDHGKYVVNGGISAWTLLNWYERATLFEGGAGAFADKKAAIPESGNGHPDVLDEARWEVEFLLKMQVPEGQPLAGMAHHKIHNAEWTSLGTPPHADTVIKRYLRPPSTAATLNLAAVAAQAARLFRGQDPAFSQRCLVAAETAWAAAKRHPARVAPPADHSGGGPYEDPLLDDEWYWAAAELYVTTGKREYLQALRSSPLDTSVTPTAYGWGYDSYSAMTWQKTEVLGKISLALATDHVETKQRARYREQIRELAEIYAKLDAAEGYRLPFKAQAKGYPWGSNSFVLNNMILLALAYDFYGVRAYLRAARHGMGYLLGRNATGYCYVTGYGTRPVENPHHRFWSHQADPALPGPPPGAVAGGPNSGLEDPMVRSAGKKGCPPQKCYMDHIEAWSANEVTINWNAPLMWVTAWLDERADATSEIPSRGDNGRGQRGNGTTTSGSSPVDVQGPL